VNRPPAIVAQPTQAYHIPHLREGRCRSGNSRHAQSETFRTVFPLNETSIFATPARTAEHRTSTRQLWRTTVMFMNNVKIVAASLRVTLSQVKGRFVNRLIRLAKIYSQF